MTPITLLSRELRRAIARMTICAAAAAIAAPLAAGAQTAAVLSFCYGPLTGLVYRIKAPSAPDKCYHSTHVEFSVKDGVGVIRSGDAAGGDLSGTYPSPTVAALAGKPLDATEPSAGAVMTFKDGKWTAAALPASGVSEERLGAAIAEVRKSLDASIQAAIQSASAAATTLQSNIDGLAASTDARFATTDTRFTGVEAAVAAFGSQVGLVGGRAVSGAQPGNGNVLAWNGSAWAPATPVAGGSSTATGTLSGYEVMHNFTIGDILPLEVFTFGIDCPTGKRAIGGGTRPTDGLVVLSSGPRVVRQDVLGFFVKIEATGWEARVRRDSLLGSETMNVYAICANLSP